MSSHFMIKCSEEYNKIEDTVEASCWDWADPRHRLEGFHVDRAEEQRVKKRKKDNKLKDDKEKKRRLLEKCMDVCKAICNDKYL